MSILVTNADLFKEPWKKQGKMNATSMMATIVLKYYFLQLFIYNWTYSFKNLFNYACKCRLASSFTLNCWVSDTISSHFSRKHTDTTYRRNNRAVAASAMESTMHVHAENSLMLVGQEHMKKNAFGIRTNISLKIELDQLLIWRYWQKLVDWESLYIMNVWT